MCMLMDWQASVQVARGDVRPQVLVVGSSSQFMVQVDNTYIVVFVGVCNGSCVDYGTCLMP